MSERIMNLNVRYYSSVEPQKVSWLWYPYIPFGKVTILQGDPGDGKSTMILDLISRLTTGTELPDGQKIKETINCVYQCSEDNLADTIKPRLLTAGADCSKVAFIDELNESLKLDDERIAKTISELGIISCKKGNVWFWKLPEKQEVSANAG